MIRTFLFATVTTIASFALATIAIAQPELPLAPVASNGKTLDVPSSNRAKGDVYYALTDRDRQIYFESNAPLEDIKGQSNQVIGYAVLSSSNPGKLAAGQWRLPVDSMKTGIELRDEHLAGKDWLDAASHPHIIVQIRDHKGVRETKRSSAFTTYTGTLVADLTLHGVTRTIEIPNTTVTVMPESEATRGVARGDLLAIRTGFNVTLADYEVSHPVIGEKVAKTVEIDVSLFLSTLPPDRQ